MTWLRRTSAGRCPAARAYCRSVCVSVDGAPKLCSITCRQSCIYILSLSGDSKLFDDYTLSICSAYVQLSLVFSVVSGVASCGETHV